MPASSAPRPSLILAQLGAVWMVGGLFLPATVRGLAGSAFGGLGALATAALVSTAIAAICLGAVITVTAPVSYLGATVRRRVWWVVLVVVVGTSLWWCGWALADEADLGVSGDPAATLVFGGLAYALVAGLLLRGWYLNVAAVAALVGLAAYGLVALTRSGPDELALRLEHARLDRATVYVVEIPGYRPTDPIYGDRLGTGGFLPADPLAIPPLRYVTIIAYPATPDVPPPDRSCGESAMDSQLFSAVCASERDGLVYRRGVVAHGYQVRRGRSVVEVVGAFAVDRGVLRHAARTLRLEDGLFVADLPGFRAQPTASPAGMQYAPADHAHGPISVQVSVAAFHAAGDDFCVLVRCEPQPDGSTYVRGDDTHAYVIRRGEVNVHAVGGVLVDRELLRRVVLAARPATDAELLRALPPPPPRGALDGLRRWLREHT